MRMSTAFDSNSMLLVKVTYIFTFFIPDGILFSIISIEKLFETAFRLNCHIILDTAFLHFPHKVSVIVT